MFRTPLRDQIGRRVTIRVGQITWRGPARRRIGLDGSS